MIVVPVLTASCQVSEKPKRGPVTAQSRIPASNHKGRVLAGQLRDPAGKS